MKTETASATQNAIGLRSYRPGDAMKACLALGSVIKASQTSGASMARSVVTETILETAVRCCFAIGVRRELIQSDNVWHHGGRRTD